MGSAPERAGTGQDGRGALATTVNEGAPGTRLTRISHRRFGGTAPARAYSTRLRLRCSTPGSASECFVPLSAETAGL